MSVVDNVVAAVTPPESAGDGRQARSKAAAGAHHVYAEEGNWYLDLKAKEYVRYVGAGALA